MATLYLLMGVITLGLFIYLLIAFVKPEIFP